jgi:predicted amidophosphoribosyltransferase
MDGQCPSCRAHLTTSWRFCPACGAAIPPEVHPPAPPPASEKAPVKGAYSGLLLGVVAAPILIIFGTLLCLTGLGAILGIPMILAGALAPLIGPMIGLGELPGKCPWCGAPVSSILNVPVFYCHACNRKIVIRKRKFTRAEDPAL